MRTPSPGKQRVAMLAARRWAVRASALRPTGNQTKLAADWATGDDQPIRRLVETEAIGKKLRRPGAASAVAGQAGQPAARRRNVRPVRIHPNASGRPD